MSSIFQIWRPVLVAAAFAASPLAIRTFDGDHGQSSADTLAWRIVDTIMVNPPEDGCCYGIQAFHLEVQSPTGWRRLPLLHLKPAQLPGRSLLLRVVNRDQTIVLRRYSLTGRGLTIVAPPTDYDSASTYPEFYAPRRLLVYVVPVPGTGSRVVVRRWSRWELVAQSPVIERCDDTLLGAVWAHDGRWVIWDPPHCTDATPETDSLAVSGP